MDDFERNALAQSAARRNNYLVNKYNTTRNNITNNTGKGTGLEQFFSGLAEKAGDVGKSTLSVLGGGIAAAKDLFGGKSGAMDNQKAFTKWLYGTDGYKDAVAKQLGTAINAADTLTDFVPGLNVVKNNPLGSAITGGITGAADELKYNGKDANLTNALERGAVGAASGLASGVVGNKLGNSSNKILKKVANSAVGRGAIQGAAGGAAGGALGSAIAGGSALSGALQGGIQGAAGGATTGAVMNAGQKALNGARGWAWKMDANEAAKLSADPYGYQGRQTEQQPTVAVANEPADGSTDGYGLQNDKTSKQLLGKKIANYGEKLQAGQASLERADIRKMEARGIDYRDTINRVRKRTGGMTNVEDQADFAQKMTGGKNSILDEIQRNALAAGNDGKGYRTTTNIDYNDIVDRNLNSTGVSLATRRKLANELATDGGATNVDLLTKASNAYNSAKKYSSKATQDAASEGYRNLYNELGRAYTEAAYAAIPDEAAADMYGAAIYKLRQNAANEKQLGNTKMAKAYESAANDLEAEPNKTVGNFRHFKKDFVDIQEIAHAKSRGDGGAAFNTANNLGSAVKTAAAQIARPLVSQAVAKAGGAVSDYGEKVYNTPTTATSNNTNAAPKPRTNGITSSNALNTVGRVIGTQQGAYAGQNTIENARQQQALDELDAQYQPEIQQTEPQLAQLQAQAQSAQANRAVAQSEKQLTQLGNAMQLALDAGDMTSYNQLAKAYETAYGIYEGNLQTAQAQGGSGSSTANLSSAQQAQLGKLAAAGNAIDELESLFTKAGGGQGIVGGNLANFMAGLGMNSDVATYNALSEGLVNQISAAVGKTDNLNTEGEVNRALTLIPKITDDEQTAKKKLSELRSLLQMNTDTYSGIYGI